MQRAFEHLHAVLERLGEALFFLLEHRGHAALAGRQFRIGLAHHARQVLDQQMKERLLLPELVAVADRAADDPAQHVAAAFVAGDHAIGDEKAAGADVVGDDLQRVAGEILRAGHPRGRLDQILEQVDLVVAVHALQHRGDALEPHAGIHRRLRAADAACRTRRG